MVLMNSQKIKIPEAIRVDNDNFGSVDSTDRGSKWT